MTIIFFTTMINAQNFWERTEPYYGTLNKIYFGGGDTVYGTLNSGFIRSVNNGTTWMPPIIINYVQDIAVAPNRTIFLAQNQQKMSRSTNKGSSFTVAGTGINEPSCTSVMVTSTGVVIAGTSRGIYRSTNNGDSWTKVAGKTEMSGDTSISAMATYDGNTLYAFTRLVIGSPDRGYAFRSTDHGLTWTKGAKSLDTATIYKASVGLNGTIYIRTGDGVRYSSDGGDSWGVLGFPDEYIGDVTTDQTGAVYASVNYKNAGAIVYKTTNNGIEWIPIKTPSVGSAGIGVNKKGDLFLSQDQIYRSTDQGASWTGLPVSFPNVGRMTETSNHQLFVTAGGSAYQNLYRSTDFGTSWMIVNTGVVGVPSVASMGEMLFVADNNYSAKLYRSDDNGKTFVPVTGMSIITGNINTLLVSAANTLIAGTSSGIFQSPDQGKNWSKVSSYPAISLQQTSGGAIFGFREFSGSGVYRSTDYGNTWQELKNGLDVTTIRSVALADNGDVYAGTNGGLFRSVNNGDEWVRIDTQKVAKPYGIYAAVGKNGNIFFGGATSGINSQCYQSSDHGATWQQIQNNIATIDNQSSLRGLYSASDGHLFAATTSGLFRSFQKITAVTGNSLTTPGSFSLSQNYPNPFNPATTINYQIPERSHVSIKIFDVVGREVATLVNEVKNGGSYSVAFSASALSSGMYIAQLQNGVRNEMKKMILLK